MDYSENVKLSEASDLAYAKWYASLPNEKKNQFFLSSYNFVVDKIRNDSIRDNPFVTESEIKLRFIELTQKEDYSPETFAFIKRKMQERIEEEWKARFREMKKKLNWSYDEMATFSGAKNGESIKASVNRKLPAFAKLLVCIYEEMKNSKK